MIPFADLPLLALDATRPWALLADLHANIEALLEVVTWLEAEGIGQTLVLGDLVGYGASPGEVVAEVEARGFVALRGNHEEMLLGMAPETVYAKERARRAIAWTASRLGAAERAYLGSLPTIGRIGEQALAVHGSLADPRHCYAYIYDLSLGLNMRAFEQRGCPRGGMVFHGHTHRAALFAQSPDREEHVLPLGANQVLADATAYFINPGSVGYSRDGDPRASFMVYSPLDRRLRWIRLPYDIERSAAGIRAAGYDDNMAERLLFAR